MTDHADLLATLLGRIAFIDPTLVCALEELEPSAALDLLGGCDDPAADQILGALLGDGWERRLFDARQLAGVDAVLALEPLGDCDD